MNFNVFYVTDKHSVVHQTFHIFHIISFHVTYLGRRRNIKKIIQIFLLLNSNKILELCIGFAFIPFTPILLWLKPVQQIIFRSQHFLKSLLLDIWILMLTQLFTKSPKGLLENLNEQTASWKPRKTVDQREAREKGKAGLGYKTMSHTLNYLQSTVSSFGV